jgi:3-oxoacyl-(acyl-carrier-protein) synthase
VLPATLGAAESNSLPIDIVSRTRDGAFGALLVNAFSFGGQTASAVFGKFS